MYSLHFTLKQHTPLIHFQHHQDGATLRASEVKPKLDRFIINSCKMTEFIPIDGKLVERPKEEFRKWFINEGKQQLALNYKMKIELPDFDNRNIEIKEGIKIITDATESCILYKGDILITIICSNNHLKCEIDKYLNEFFVVTSFGKRQNKGFGSFYKKSIDFEKEVKPILKNYNWYLHDIDKKNLLDFDASNHKNNYQFYLLISDCWRKLKSGFNFQGIYIKSSYIKSSVFKYLCNQGIRWDKRWIKKELKPLILPNTLNSSRSIRGANNEPNDCGGKNYQGNINQPDYQNWIDNPHYKGEYRFGRAMLGLAEHYEFKAGNNTYQVQIKSNQGIERYKAPVTFKVFDIGNNNYKVFAIAEDQLLYDKDFYFETKIKQNNIVIGTLGFKTGSTDKLVKTPSEKEWNLIDFLDTFLPSQNFIKQ